MLPQALRRSVFWALLLASLLIPAALKADVYASIRGTVTDPAGAVVPGAKIVATNGATEIVTTTEPPATSVPCGT